MPDEATLGRIPLFARLSDSQRQIIAAAMEQRSYHAGDNIFVQGTPVDGMVVLVSGQAVLFSANADGSQTPLATLVAGQSINHEALFDEALQSATLRAAQPCTVRKLRRSAFHQLLAQQPDLRSAFEVTPDEPDALQIHPRFAEQREDEEILIQTHRHWWSFVRTAWLPLILMPAMWVAAVLVEAQVLTIALLVLSAALPGLGLIYFYLEWRNDSVIVTDQRIIRITRTILALHRQVTQVGMESIHEINFDIPPYDLFARLFRYGTVIVKTAGAQGNLELPLMPNPERFQKLIMEDRQYFENRQAQRHQKLVRAEMQRWLAGESAEDDSAAAADGPPRPLPGSKGYLSTKIVMSNGDIVYRKHISVWAQHTALPLLAILIGLAALILTFTLISPDIRIVTFPASMVALLAGFLTYYWLDWDWRNDVYIISDDIITLVHKRPFFLQNLRDQILVERIDNVESESTGLFAALMKYGNVSMSLVGADEPKRFVKVPNPQAIQQEISRRQHKKSQRRAHYDAMQQQHMLGEYLGISPAATDSKTTADGGKMTVVGGNSAGNSQISPSAAATGTIRAAQNTDRNRPSRLPEKSLPPIQPGSNPDFDPKSSRRPQRFRPDGEV
ncbi:MAG: cyclic nucleotide-binding domain-containing protein [Chloroflexi bacterium]|nr:cyclic nucleotide-binding domain-containing protein [Chloroflexota bacterium]